MLERTQAPAFQTIQQIDYIKAVTSYLDNGIPVHVINAGKQPVIGIEFIFKAGSVQEPENGVAHFTMKMLSEGTRTKSAADISNYIDQYGAYISLNPDTDFSTLGIYALKKYFGVMLDLCRELLTQATFPETELETLKSIKQQQLKVDNEKSNVLASKKFRATLFGASHPYGKTLTKEAIEGINRDALAEFFQTHYQQDLQIVLSGQVEKNYLQLLNNYFGSLNTDQPHSFSKSQSSGAKLTALVNGQRQVLVEKPESLQSSIRVGKLLFTKAHSDFTKMKVVNTLLGGYFGSRLMRNIREEKGFTYGISSALVSFKDAGYFIIGTDVKKEFTRQTLEEIYKEIQVLVDHPIEEEELNTLKNYMAGRLLSSVDTPFALVDKFKAVHLHGLDYDYYSRYLETINYIDAQTIQAMADQYLKKETMLEVIVGGGIG